MLNIRTLLTTDFRGSERSLCRIPAKTAASMDSARNNFSTGNFVINMRGISCMFLDTLAERGIVPTVSLPAKREN